MNLDIMHVSATLRLLPRAARDAILNFVSGFDSALYERARNDRAYQLFRRIRT